MNVSLDLKISFLLFFFAIQAIVYFNHRFGCTKCMTPGTFFRPVRRMSFHRIPNTEQEREQEHRTDLTFRNRLQPQHHHEEKSILENLPIDMVAGFPSSDPLHLLELGIMKRLNISMIFEKNIRKHLVKSFLKLPFTDFF